MFRKWFEGLDFRRPLAPSANRPFGGFAVASILFNDDGNNDSRFRLALPSP